MVNEAYRKVADERHNSAFLKAFEGYLSLPTHLIGHFGIARSDCLTSTISTYRCLLMRVLSKPYTKDGDQQTSERQAPRLTTSLWLGLHQRL
jgi:hypothetical protein